jgi:hypothetical protein
MQSEDKNEQTATHYTVEKSRFYRADETYNNGEGFCGGTPDLEQAKLWFATFSRPDGDRINTVELREGSRIIERVGPDMEATNRSMHAAWVRRYRKAT